MAPRINSSFQAAWLSLKVGGITEDFSLMHRFYGKLPMLAYGLFIVDDGSNFEAIGGY